MDVERFLNEARVEYEVHGHTTAYTAQGLAAVEHVSGSGIAKSVAVYADDSPVLCVLPASYKIDLDKLAAVLGVKDCRLADELDLEHLFPDTELGAEPPFGKPYGLQTLVDEHLALCDTITFNAGTHRQAIRMRYSNYARLAEPLVLDFAVHR